MTNIGSSDPLPAGSNDPELASRLAAVREDEERKRKHRERVARERRFLIPIFVVVVALFPNFGRAKVVGQSMEPRYHEGDPLVLLKTFRIFSPLKPGDVIVIKKKTGPIANEEFVKRVVFIQSKEGNTPFPKTFGTSRGEQQSVDFFPWYEDETKDVPPGGIIVIGDNTDVSQDSRDEAVGVIKDDEILGKVLNR
jgi:signal peptidase I